MLGRKAKLEFLLELFLLSLQISLILSKTLAEIRNMFKGSAVLRAKPAMLIRNALAAAGNSGDPELLSAVQAWKEHEDPGIRGAAGWAAKKLLQSQE